MTARRQTFSAATVRMVIRDSEESLRLARCDEAEIEAELSRARAARIRAEERLAQNQADLRDAERREPGGAGGHLCRAGHGIDQDPFAREWSGPKRRPRPSP